MRTHSFYVLCPEFEEGDNFSVDNKKVTCSKCNEQLNLRNSSRLTPRGADSLKAGRNLPAKKSNSKGIAPA